MTAIVGVICEDGVVIGSDSATSFGVAPGFNTIEQRAKKIHIIDNRIVVSGTGAVGLNQRFCHAVNRLTKNFTENAEHIEIGKLLSKTGCEDFKSTFGGMPQKGFGYGCLVAFAIGKKFHLLELGTADFQPEFKTPDTPFVTLGSGQIITDPFVAFLRKIFFTNGPPNLQDGKFITVWALLHAIELNASGGINGPVQVAVLKLVDGKAKATLLDAEELEEQAASVKAAEDHLRSFQKDLAGANPVAIPPAPQNPPAAKP